MIRFVFKSDLSTELSRCELKGHLVTVQTDRIVSLSMNNIRWVPINRVTMFRKRMEHVILVLKGRNDLWIWQCISYITVLGRLKMFRCTRAWQLRWQYSVLSSSGQYKLFYFLNFRNQLTNAPNVVDDMLRCWYLR